MQIIKCNMIMKYILRWKILVWVFISLLFSVLKLYAQTPGPNVLVNADFKDMKKPWFYSYNAQQMFNWPNNWVYDSRYVAWGGLNYPAIKCLVENNVALISTWAQSYTKVSMYQNLTGLANGSYVFSIQSKEIKTGDGKSLTCAIFASGYGGDSIFQKVAVSGTSWQTFTLDSINVTTGKCKVGIYLSNGGGADTQIKSLKFNVANVANQINIVSAPSQITPNGTNLISVDYITEQDGSILLGLYNKDAQLITEADLFIVKASQSGIAKIDVSSINIPTGTGYYWDAKLVDKTNTIMLTATKSDISVLDGTENDSITIVSSSVLKNGDVKYAVFYRGNGVDSIKTFLLNSVSEVIGNAHVKVYNGSETINFNVTPSSELLQGTYELKAELYYHGVQIINNTLQFSVPKAPSIPGQNLLKNSDFSALKYLGSHNFDFYWPNNWVYVSDKIIWGGGGTSGYPCFAFYTCYYSNDNKPYPIIGTWTGTESEGTMYQDVNNLENGTYEFTLEARGVGSNTDSYMFASGFGGDSTSTMITVNSTTRWKKSTSAKINVANGKCRIGLYIKNRMVGTLPWYDIQNLNFHYLYPTKINNLKNSSQVIYPNPLNISGTLHIENQQNGVSNLTIMDMQGRVVASKSFSNSASFNASELNLQTGLYLVKINQDVTKLLVQ